MVTFRVIVSYFWKSLSFDEMLLIAIAVIVFSMLVILRHFEKPTAEKLSINSIIVLVFVTLQ